MTNTIEFSSFFHRKVIGLTFVFGMASLAFAQEKITLKGSVKEQSNLIIPYASVTFKNGNTDALSDAILTDKDGNYSIVIAPGQYQVTIDAVGYRPYQSIFSIGADKKVLDFSIIKENSSSKEQEIAEVTITATSSKPYKVELDKKSYNVNADLVSKGGNLQDVLQNVPSVSVDMDGSITMRGNSNVRFLINGKPSSLLGIDDGANALETISADRIERIEVITNPSSKYEASGTAGILNIILKKEKKYGFNGSVTGTLGYLPKTNLSTSLNWKKGDWSWFVNGASGLSRRESTRNTSTLRKEDPFNLSPSQYPFTQRTAQRGESKSDGKFYNFSAGVNRDIGENTSLNLSGTIRSFNNEYTNQNNYDEDIYSIVSSAANPSEENNIELNNIFRSRTDGGLMDNFASQIDLGLDQKIGDKGQTLSVSGSFQTNKTNSDSQINQLSYIASGLAPQNNAINNVNSKAKTTTFIGKADYELPIGEKSLFEAGTRYDFNKNTYDYFVDESRNNSPYIIRYDFTSNTLYKENILGIYSQFKSKIGENFAYQVGLRAESSSIDIDFDYYQKNSASGEYNLVHQKVKKSYTKFFHSVFLSYALTKENQLLFNLSSG